MKNIFITGIAGLVGSNLAKHLLQKNYNITGCDILVGGYEDNVPKNIGWYNTDILKLNQLKKVMEGSDIVIHTAALPYEGVSVFSPKLVSENIFSGTTSVATAAIHNKVKLFINCSSMARYGNGNPPFGEMDDTVPEDPYGLAKVCAEDMLKLLYEMHGLKYFTIVPHNIIGPGQVYTDPYRNVAAIFTNRILLGKSIIIYGDGKQTRSFSHINDCVNAIEILIKKQNIIESGQVFNIGPENNEITIKDLALLVGKKCNIIPKLEFFPERPREVKHAHCSSHKAKKLLNYSSRYSNEQTIEDIVNWVKKRGPKEFDYHLPLEVINETTPKTWTERLM